MKSIVLKAIMERYGSLVTLFDSMRECQDAVCINLAVDIDFEFDEDEIHDMIINVMKNS